MLCSRTLALPSVARRPGYELVCHAADPGTASDGDGGRLPTHTASDVHVAVPLFHCAAARAPELVCWAVLSGYLWNPLRSSTQGRGGDDARGIRRRVPRIHEPNDENHPRRLVA